MASVWCVNCDSWRGGGYAYGEKALWTGHVVTFAKLLKRPGNLQRFHSTSCARFTGCIAQVINSAPSNEGSKRVRQHLLWKTFFQDHTRWWDNRHQKTNSRSPDFRHMESGEVLFLDSCHKPAWVDAHLAILDARMDHIALASSLPQDLADQFGSPGSANRVTPQLVTNLCRQEQVKEAVEVLEVLVGKDFGIDKDLLYFVLKECVAKKGLTLGSRVHALAVKMGYGSDPFLCNHFIRMYAGHGKLREAMDVFRGVALPDAFMWSSIISAYAKLGQAEEAIKLYQHMRAIRTKPDNYVFVAALQACAAAGDLQSGKQMHDDVLNCGMEHDMFICNCLVDMYAKCGSLTDARIVFDGLGKKDVVTWTAMISGYSQQEGMGQEALNLYSAMHSQGMAVPNVVTFVCLLQACSNVGVAALEKGKQLHSELEGRGLECNVVVGSSLVNMYAKCGSLKDARTVFDRLGEKNVVTWNAMIAAYAQKEGSGQEALGLYSVMRHEGRTAPNEVTFVCFLQACANVGVSALKKGKQLHSQIKERRLESDVDVGGSLVNMYAKCGSLTDARIVFDALREKNVVTWTAMIAGYAQEEGMGKKALTLYSAMNHEGMAAPNAVTYVCLLEACASLGALQQGKQLHLEICKGGFESNARIGNCLVKMYAQCGRLDASREVFDKLPIKSLETWTALLKGYAEHGEGSMAIQCFEDLLQQGIQPSEVTYICLLTACSHAGLVDQGLQYFETMEERYGVKPDDWHYTCMVDLLGRSGHLDRAEQLLRASGLASSIVCWTALLSACKSYGDAALGRRCFDHLVNLQPAVATPYVLLGSIYANAGKWDEVERVEMLRSAAGARKKPAKACIEVKKEVHEFTVGDERSDVAATLRKMNIRAKAGGHVPQTQLVLRAVPEQEKEDALCGHAEKLALAYGLLNTPSGSTLVVTKNLRMCDDCHSSTKIMSQVERREIVVRDGHKVHRFHDGVCSCHDRP